VAQVVARLAAVPVGAVGAQERLQVELIDHVEHEPGEVVGWQPVTQVGWEQEGLFYVFASLAPNVLILNNLFHEADG
jgi:hypothetical protein